MTNLKSLGSSLALYSADHDNRLPEAGRWTDAAAAYGLDAQITHCPSVAKFGYAFHRALGGKSISAVPNAKSTALLFDSVILVGNANDDLTSLPSPGRHATGSGGHGNLAAFLDGHANWVPR